MAEPIKAADPTQSPIPTPNTDPPGSLRALHLGGALYDDGADAINGAERGSAIAVMHAIIDELGVGPERPALGDRPVTPNRPVGEMIKAVAALVERAREQERARMLQEGINSLP